MVPLKKKNYGKCEMIGVWREDCNVAFFANVFRNKVWKFPFKYLGFPLCLGLQKNCLLDSIVERIDEKLSSWKGRYLSMGGRVTIIK